MSSSGSLSYEVPATRSHWFANSVGKSSCLRRSTELRFKIVSHADAGRIAIAFLLHLRRRQTGPIGCATQGYRSIFRGIAERGRLIPGARVVRVKPSQALGEFGDITDDQQSGRSGPALGGNIGECREGTVRNLLPARGAVRDQCRRRRIRKTVAAQ